MATIIPNAGAAGWESSADLGQMYTQGLLQGIRSGMEAATAKNLKLMDQLQQIKMIESGLTAAGAANTGYAPSQTQRDVLNKYANKLREQAQTSLVQGKLSSDNTSTGDSGSPATQTKTTPTTKALKPATIPSFGRKIK